MKSVVGLLSVAAVLLALGGANAAQAASSGKACMRGEQRIGGVCKPSTRSGTPLHGQYKGSTR